MVLQHVTERTGFVVVVGTSGNARLFRHGNLHVIDVIAVPERLDERVGEAEHQEILDRFLAQIMINPVNLFLVEGVVQQPVQLPGAVDVFAEGLFHHDPMQTAWPVQSGLLEPLDDLPEIGRFERQIERCVGAALVGAEPVAQDLIDGRIMQVARDIGETCRETPIDAGVELFARAPPDAFLQMLEPIGLTPRPPPQGDDRHASRQVPPTSRR